jgi:hypothetical protein
MIIFCGYSGGTEVPSIGFEEERTGRRRWNEEGLDHIEIRENDSDSRSGFYEM